MMIKTLALAYAGVLPTAHEARDRGDLGQPPRRSFKAIVPAMPSSVQCGQANCKRREKLGGEAKQLRKTRRAGDQASTTRSPRSYSVG